MRGAAPIVQTLGMHTNDKTISFYAGTPAGFAVEYGTGGILIDDRRGPRRGTPARTTGDTHARRSPQTPTPDPTGRRGFIPIRNPQNNMTKPSA